MILVISSPHRSHALQGIEWLINELKDKVEIWKKEVFENGFLWKENESMSTDFNSKSLLTPSLSLNAQSHPPTTTPEKENIYETQSLLNQYLNFHFGPPSPFETLTGIENFPQVCSRLIETLWKETLKTKTIPSGPIRGLDLGCAVGRSSFEMLRYCDQVVGVDYSQSFIHAANQLLKSGSIDWEMCLEGEKTSSHSLELSSLMKEVESGKTGWKLVETIFGSSVKPQSTSFQSALKTPSHSLHFLQGDAHDLALCLTSANLCSSSPSLSILPPSASSPEPFHIIMGANLIDRLTSPLTFLKSLPSLLHSNGLYFNFSPYTWLEDYTPKDSWIGGQSSSGWTGEELEKVMLSLGLERVYFKSMPDWKDTVQGLGDFKTPDGKIGGFHVPFMIRGKGFE